MKLDKVLFVAVVACAAVFLGESRPARAVAAQEAAHGASHLDGQHAFDFHFGTWRTHILSRQSTPSGGVKWIKMVGTVADLPVWHGRANLEKIEASGPGAHFQGITMFLFDPRSEQWSQQFVSSANGIVSAALYGEFKNGRCELYGQLKSGDQMVLERAIWSNVTRNSYHFELASSVDGGKTWVTKFIAQLTRTSKSANWGTEVAGAGAGAGPGHDYDFNIGNWKTDIRAVLRPLSAPGSWSQLHGTHIVHPVWNAWADIGELEADGPNVHIEDLALRLYDRQTLQWRVYFANSKSGLLLQPMIGSFRGDVGTFVGLDEMEGQTVLIRNVWSGITSKTCHQDWAISVDGGKTWVPTWSSIDTRQA